MEKTSKIPMPPPAMLLPIEFWLEIDVILDKRLELIRNGSGHGVVRMEISMRDQQVYGVTFEERTTLRSLVKKAGNLATQPDVPVNETPPTTETK
jgi:hypothetical protein